MSRRNMRKKVEWIEGKPHTKPALLSLTVCFWGQIKFSSERVKVHEAAALGLLKEGTRLFPYKAMAKYQLSAWSLPSKFIIDSSSVTFSHAQPRTRGRSARETASFLN